MGEGLKYRPPTPLSPDCPRTSCPFPSPRQGHLHRAFESGQLPGQLWMPPWRISCPPTWTATAGLQGSLCPPPPPMDVAVWVYPRMGRHEPQKEGLGGSGGRRGQSTLSSGPRAMGNGGFLPSLTCSKEFSGGQPGPLCVLWLGASQLPSVILRSPPWPVQGTPRENSVESPPAWTLPAPS